MFFQNLMQTKCFSSWSEYKRARTSWRLTGLVLLMASLCVAVAGAFCVYAVTYQGWWIRPGMETAAKVWVGSQGSLLAVGYLMMSAFLVYRLWKGPRWEVYIIPDDGGPFLAR